MKDENCSCGETTVDPWCIACCTIEPISIEDCYYCGKPTDSFAGDPGNWPVSLPHSTDPGVMKNHHIRCVVERLEAIDKIEWDHSESIINFHQITCDHTFIPSDPEGQIEYQSSGVICSKCKFYPQTWYCPDSPDHQCVYSEDYDSCDFCGEPEERK